jgi:DNA repair exonuclease SbcCD ATPase subunit
MKLRKLTHKNLAENFRTVEIDFPDTGKMLVTGKNASGKSTGTLEATSTVFFGKTVIADPIWREDTAGMIRGELDSGVVATRRMSKAGNQKFDVTGEGFSEAVTGTKAKANLAKYLPSREVWRAACVFGNDMMGAFSLANDKQRKAMVEELLGLQYLDPALKTADQDWKKAKQLEHALNLARVQAEGQANAAAARLEALQQVGKSPSEDDLQALRGRHAELSAEVMELSAQQSDLSTKIQKLEEKRNEILRDVSGANAALQQLSAQRQSMLGGTCPTCGQDIAGQDTSAIDGAISEAEAALKGHQCRQQDRDLAELPNLQKLSSAANQRIQATNSEMASINAQGMAMKRQREEAENLATTTAEAEAKHSSARVEHEKAVLEHAAAERESRVCAEAREGLSVKGVRTQLLPSALAAITNVANSWLAMISGPTLSIDVFEQNDKVHLKIYGRGCGTYKSLSLGYRLRVDLALMLAFGEVARQSFGMESVTMFFDEPFLGFDAQGIEIVMSVLNTLAEKHCVVVITNQPTVARSLKPNVHYHVSDGTYKRAA